MKSLKTFYAVLLLLVALLATGCEKPVPLPQEESIAVTYNTLDGCWQLTMWQGRPIDDDTYLYIEFDRHERRFEMWDNLNSMYPVKSSGSFAISQEEDGSYTLSGSYDYGVGNWNSDYQVSLSNKGNEMKWISQSGPFEAMDFVRIDTLPELN